jgi:hypothetical protein
MQLVPLHHERDGRGDGGYERGKSFGSPTNSSRSRVPLGGALCKLRIQFTHCLESAWFGYPTLLRT